MTGSDATENVRIAYDQSVDMFLGAVGTEFTGRVETAADIALVDDFVLRLEPGSVLDIGCGPGRIAAHLYRSGIDVAGVDLSPEMVRAARVAHPDIEFEVGSLDSLPVETGALIGAVYWYSIINTASDALDAVWTELKRALRPGGTVLIAFQAGDGDGDFVTTHDAYGSSATITSYRHSIDVVADSLRRTDFTVIETTLRKRELEFESTPQAFISAHLADR